MEPSAVCDISPDKFYDIPEESEVSVYDDFNSVGDKTNILKIVYLHSQTVATHISCLMASIIILKLQIKQRRTQRPFER
jgi:hypothetical protein